MNNKVLFISEHPAYLGGITRKCEVLEKELKKYHELDKISINVKEHKILSFGIALIRILLVLKKYKGIIYCLDNSRMYLLLKFQNFFYPSTLKKTIIVYSGGSFEELLDDKYRKAIECIRNSKQLWIEIQSVTEQLLKSGYHNIKYYPNPRIIQVEKSPRIFTEGKTLRLLYYSQISREKGLLDAIEVVNLLNNSYNIDFTMDFYGLVKDDIKEIFYEFIENNQNVSYVGFNDAKNLEEYYEVLNKYDLMIFPTYWIGEGIAGACVEAKISGVAIIASNHNYNMEIVSEDAGEGIIVEKGNVVTMAKKIYDLYCDIDRLNQMKIKSFDSRKRYDVDAYQDLYAHCFDD